MSSVSLPRFAAAASLALVVAACAGARPSASPSAEAAATQPAAIATSTPGPSVLPVETAAPASLEPIPTAAPGNYLAGLRYACGGADFPIEIFDVPEKAEESSDPPAAVLRGELLLYGTATWWLIDRTQTRAQYVGRNEAGTYWYLLAELQDGAWRAVGYGDCMLRAVVQDAKVVTWWIRKDDWPAPGDRNLRLTVRDGCPKTVADRLLQPLIRSNSASIVIVLPTEVVRQTSCGQPNGNEQLAPVTIRLDEPVGDRQLFDGQAFPLRNAHIRSEPIAWCCG